MRIKFFLYKARWFVPQVINVIKLRIRHIPYGNRLSTVGPLFIRGTGSISIGENVTINSCLEANPIGGDTRTILYAKDKGRIIIGNNVGISNTAIVALNMIIIEDNVLIGGGCKIYDHDFHSLQYEDRVIGPDVNVRNGSVIIQEGAFIGANSIILKGVIIGRHSVVGAGSVVTKNIPDNEIWAGNPAKKVRELL